MGFHFPHISLPEIHVPPIHIPPPPPLHIQKPKIDMSALQKATGITVGVLSLFPPAKMLIGASLAISDSKTGGAGSNYLNDGHATNSTLNWVPGGFLAQNIANQVTHGDSGNTLSSRLIDPVGIVKHSLFSTPASTSTLSVPVSLPLPKPSLISSQFNTVPTVVYSTTSSTLQAIDSKTISPVISTLTIPPLTESKEEISPLSSLTSKEVLNTDVITTPINSIPVEAQNNLNTLGHSEDSHVPVQSDTAEVSYLPILAVAGVVALLFTH